MSEKMADDFLMSPMVDYCFKELLAYPTVRKGFLAAILNRDPSEIGHGRAAGNSCSFLCRRKGERRLSFPFVRYGKT